MFWLRNKKIIFNYILFSKGLALKVIKPFLCSTQLRMEIIMVINVKMSTIVIVGSFTFKHDKYSI